MPTLQVTANTDKELLYYHLRRENVVIVHWMVGLSPKLGKPNVNNLHLTSWSRERLRGGRPRAAVGFHLTIRPSVKRKTTPGGTGKDGGKEMSHQQKQCMHENCQKDT